ncbi:MAG: phosphomannomutase/phosphoglucomutase [Kiritimatiellae bacterium]|nr:phosphomannomutase/phosphoglucomutase [Kiritimatiellia bacterium]
MPVGYADGLDKVEQMVGESRVAGGVKAGRASQVADALPRYVRWQREAAASAPYSSLRYAVDCSNGMASLLAGELFPGAEIINGTIDGKFPAHSPNPLKAEARTQIAAVVREHGLDCGVTFDGDADRAMFVDERGEFVQPDYLIPVVARATRAAPAYAEATAGKQTLPKIIHDVRTSRGATETLREDGFEPVMVPVGHAFAKPALRRTGALCGGELAGHYYFREFHCCDSGVLAATRVLGEIARAKAAGRSFSEMMRPIVSRYANSGEMNFEVADKDAAIARVVAAAESLAAVESESRIDGVRLDFAEGWVSVRKSNTEPYLRLIVECRTQAMLDDWKGRLTAAVKG